MIEITHKPATRAEVMDIVTTWAEAWWPPAGDEAAAISPDVLSDEAFLSTFDGKPAVISFIYSIPASKLSIHGYLLSDPKLSAMTRGRVIQSHLPSVIARAEDLGNSYQMWLTDHDHLARSLKENHGFREGFQSPHCLYRKTDGAEIIGALEP